MATQDMKDVVNALYDGVLMAMGVVGSRYALTEMGVKNRPIELKPKSIAMLGAEMATSTFVIQKLKTSGVLPDKIWK